NIVNTLVRIAGMLSLDIITNIPSSAQVNATSHGDLSTEQQIQKLIERIKHLSPSVECWYLCRKPLAERSIAAQVLKTGTGALNIDGCRIEVPQTDPNKRQDTGGYKKTKSEAIVPY